MSAIEITFEWVTDDDADLSWADEEITEGIALGRFSVDGCIAWITCECCGERHQGASLWGIVSDDTDEGIAYRNEVESDLRYEAEFWESQKVSNA